MRKQREKKELGIMDQKATLKKGNCTACCIISLKALIYVHYELMMNLHHCTVPRITILRITIHENRHSLKNTSMLI